MAMRHAPSAICHLPSAPLLGHSILGRGTTIGLQDIHVALDATRHFTAACIDWVAAAAMDPPAHVGWVHPATDPTHVGVG